MSQREKTIQKTKNNPQGWRLEDCKSLADYYRIRWNHQKSSHCVFDFGEISLTVVAKKDGVKAVYIKRFVEQIEKAREP